MMDVIENMLLAEAVVPRTLGAVAELQIRKIRVRPAADLAFVVVAPLAFLLLHRLAELDGLRAVPGLELVRPSVLIIICFIKSVKPQNKFLRIHSVITYSSPGCTEIIMIARAFYQEITYFLLTDCISHFLWV